MFTDSHTLRQIYCYYGLSKALYGACAAGDYVDNWNDPLLAPTKKSKANPRSRGDGRYTITTDKCPADRVNRSAAYCSLERAHTAACRTISGVYKNCNSRVAERIAGFRDLHTEMHCQMISEDEKSRRTVPDGGSLPCAKWASVLDPETQSDMPMFRHLPYSPAEGARAQPYLRYFLDIAAGTSRNSHETVKLRENQRRYHEAQVYLEPDVVLTTDGGVDQQGDGIVDSISSALLLMPDELARCNTEYTPEVKPEKGVKKEKKAIPQPPPPTGVNECVRSILRAIPNERKRRADAGCYACSYSAETYAGHLGLDLAIEWFENNPSSAPRTLTWVSDSRSLLQALQKGPISQTSFAEAQLMLKLLKLVAMGISINMVFSFSHCGFLINELADALCGDELGERNNAPPATSIWHKDSRRPRRRGVREAADQACKDAEEVLPSIMGKWRPNPNPFKAPGARTECVFWPEKVNRRLTPADTKTLNRLKSGALAKLGGHLHGHPERCELCGEEGALARGGKAIVHLFECGSEIAAELRETHFSSVQTAINPSLLWKQPQLAVNYTRAFCAASARIRNLESRESSEDSPLDLSSASQALPMVHPVLESVEGPLPSAEDHNLMTQVSRVL